MFIRAISYSLFKILFWLTCFLFSKSVKAQPNVDIISINSQYFISKYDSTNQKIYTQDNFLNLFIPKKFGKGHVLLIRVNAEQLNVSRSDTVNLNYSLYSLSVPIGLQLQSKNEKWKFTGIIIPKINSDFKDNINYDGQFGGIGLVTRVFSKTFQARAGLYYNSDFWGHFFMPLFGVDWKVNYRFRMYGTLPGNYRFEYNVKNKFFAGIGFRSAQRSFRLEAKYDDDFVRVRENQLKIFCEGFIVGNFLIGFDVYRSINYNLVRYDYFKTKTEKPGLNVFTKSKDAWGATVNLAYRIRQD